MAAPMDRAAAVRAALRSLVARNGFHGASMSAVAREAGVATGTAYTHYASKDELVLAAYCETKAALAVAATAGLSHRAAAGERFHAMWLSCYRHLKANPEHALFLLQVEHSPYRASAHEAALANENDPLVAQVALPDVAARLLPLPLDVLYELALSPAVRLAAGDIELTEARLDEVADACWRAISLPGCLPPLPSRATRVDRRLNRRYDADQNVTAFAARLKDAVDPDAVRDGLPGVLQRSLEPTHVTLWIRQIR